MIYVEARVAPEKLALLQPASHILIRATMKEVVMNHRTKPNGQQTPEYTAWCHMRSRCLSTKDPQYYMYGERGIDICERWSDFDMFIADVGKRPSSIHSLDRIDNSKGYSPENCRWATSKQQGRNTRRNRIIHHNGRAQPMSQWAEELGIHYRVLKSRLDRGWSVERAFSTRNFKYSEPKRVAEFTNSHRTGIK